MSEWFYGHVYDGVRLKICRTCGGDYDWSEHAERCARFKAQQT